MQNEQYHAQEVAAAYAILNDVFRGIERTGLRHGPRIRTPNPKVQSENRVTSADEEPLVAPPA